jgi:anti-anti-sigma regulatory factor
MVEINSTRLLIDLEALRRIGGHGTGVVREAFTAADLEGRRVLSR